MIRRTAFLTLVLGLALAAPAAASPWTVRVLDHRPGTEDPTPRAAVAVDGSGLVAWSAGPALVALPVERGGPAAGRARRIDARGATDWSAAAAPGGAAIVVWTDRDRALHAAVRRRAGGSFTARAVATSSGSDINAVEVAADPRGGWVVAERRYPRSGSGRPYRIRVLSLDAAGRPAGTPQDLGRGQFGLGNAGRALAVAADGTATVAFTSEPGEDETQRVLVSSRPHGGTFGPPVAVAAKKNALQADATVAATDRAVVALTDVVRCGDVGCFGAPQAAAVGPAGPLAPAGPALASPGRAFTPSAAPIGASGTLLAFAQKPAPSDFSAAGDIKATVLGGSTTTLARGDASSPLALPLSGGRALVTWLRRGRYGAALVAPGGGATATPAPPGAAPEGYADDHDLATGGRYAVVAWTRGGVVRVAVRRF